MSIPGLGTIPGISLAGGAGGLSLGASATAESSARVNAPQTINFGSSGLTLWEVVAIAGAIFGGLWFMRRGR